MNAFFEGKRHVLYDAITDQLNIHTLLDENIVDHGNLLLKQWKHYSLKDGMLLLPVEQENKYGMWCG